MQELLRARIRYINTCFFVLSFVFYFAKATGPPSSGEGNDDTTGNVVIAVITVVVIILIIILAILAFRR